MKRIGSLLLVAFLLLTLTIPAFAAEIPLVTDVAEVLTDAQYDQLNDLAEEITGKYRCDVAIVVIDGLEGDDVYETAWAVYDAYDFGYGADRSGLLFLLSMEERDYALIAYGYGNTAFTDHGKDTLLDSHVLPLLAKDQYYAAFTAYLGKADEYLEMARAGEPFDVHNDPAKMAESKKSAFWWKLGITVLLPLLIAGGLCMMWRGQMKTAVPQRAAAQYIPQGGFRLTVSEDRFLYQTETRRTIEKKSSGGTTTDSRGGSGRSGKF